MARIIHNFALPYQKISWKEKQANDKQFFRECINGIVPLGFDTNYDHYSYRKILSNYKLYNNILDPIEIKEVCDAVQVDVGQFEQGVMPYNITYRKVNKMLGEERRRGLNLSVYLINEQAIDERDEELKNLIRQWVEQKVQFELLKMSGQLEQMPPEEVQKIHDDLVAAKSPEELDSVGYLSQRQIANKHILNLIIERENVEIKKNLGFKHALLADTEIIFVHDDNRGARIEVINPLHFGVFKSPETQFIQDGVAAYWRKAMYREDVLETYGSEFTSEQFEKYKMTMKTRSNGTGISRWVTSERQMKYYRNNYPSNEGRQLAQLMLGGAIEESVGIGQHGDIIAEDFSWVVYAQWRGYTEVIFVTRYNELGQQTIEIEDVNFEIPKKATRITYWDEGVSKTRYEWTDEFGQPISAEYEWIARTYEGMRIDSEYFIRMREVPNQFTSADNPYESRLDFIGCVYTNMNAESVTYIDRIRPFHALYLVVMETMKKLIGNERGMVSAYDTSQLDKNLDDPETGRDALEMTRYYEQSQSSVYYNSMVNYYGSGMAPNRPAGFSVASKSNASYVGAYIQVADWIEAKAGLAASINPSRDGQTQAREAVRNVQANVMSASDETDYLMNTHDKVWQDVLYCAVQKEKRIWKKRIAKGERFVGQYILRPSTLQSFNIEDIYIDDNDIGLYYTDARREAEFSNFLMQAVQSMTQSDKLLVSDMTTIVKSLTMQRPIEEIEMLIKVSENRQLANKQQEAEKQREFESQMKQAEAQLEEVRHKRELEKIMVKSEEDRKTEIQKASVVALGFSTEKDIDSDGVQDVVEQQIKLQDSNTKADKVKLEQQQVSVENAKNAAQQKLK